MTMARAAAAKADQERPLSDILRATDSEGREVQIMPRDTDLEKAEKAVAAGMAEFHNVARQRNEWMERYQEERLRNQELTHALEQEKEAGKLRAATITQELKAEGHRRETERQVLEDDRERLQHKLNEVESQLITAQARIGKLEAGITMIAGNLADMLSSREDAPDEQNDER